VVVSEDMLAGTIRVLLQWQAYVNCNWLIATDKLHGQDMTVTGFAMNTRRCGRSKPGLPTSTLNKEGDLNMLV